MMKISVLCFILMTIFAFPQSDKLEEARSHIKDKEFSSALNVLNELAEKDQSSYEILYLRSVANLYTNNIEKSIEDASSAIKINASQPQAYLLRAQLFFSTNEKEKACKDAQKAADLGAEQAKMLVQKYCSNSGESVIESLSLDWPDEENWNLANHQENQGVTMIELTRNNETLENWSELGSMVSYNNVSGMSMEAAMNLMLTSSKANSPNVEQLLIEKDETGEYPWVIFKMENAGSANSPEAQIWYVTQGKQTLFTAFRAVRKSEISDDLQTKWVKFFKSGKVIPAN